MGRPLPLHVTLGRLTSEARETLAKKLLALDVLRDAASKAALQGLNVVCIPIGPAFLGQTSAAKELASTLKGCTFEWVEIIGRDGLPIWELRMGWPLSGESGSPANP